MSDTNYALPEIVSQEEWLNKRKALLEEEKKMTRQRDKVNAKRRHLPMVKVEKEYIFEGPGGQVSLMDLFDGRRQLLVHHFMWFDDTDRFCPSCSFEADQNYNKYFFAELHKRDITLVAIARAPYTRIEKEKQKKEWRFPFYSSTESDFNYDFQATIDGKKNTLYNYEEAENINWLDGYEGDLTARSIFLRDGDTAYHAYSAYTRGLGLLATHYNYLDLTPYGRQEDWENSPEGWPQNPIYE